MTKQTGLHRKLTVELVHSNLCELLEGRPSIVEIQRPLDAGEQEKAEHRCPLHVDAATREGREGAKIEEELLRKGIDKIQDGCTTVQGEIL